MINENWKSINILIVVKLAIKFIQNRVKAL